MGEDDGRQLDAALAALIERALRESGAEGGPGAPSATERTNRLARVLAAGLRELVRAPLREALQAGYELGVQAAQAGQRPAAPPPAAGVAPPAAPAAAESPAPPARPTSGTGRTPVTVEVGPFPGFSAVNRFHAALAEAPGVGEVVVVGFREGQLCLRVDHPDVDALAALLERLHPGHARVLRPAADRLTVALGDDLPAPAVEPTTPGSTAGADDR